jgi:RNA-directed DNA polymerase
LVKLDIHDFFESISERRVYFAFRGCGYQPLVSFELARLCTRVHSTYAPIPPGWRSSRREEAGVIRSYADARLGHLPQGAPTSPMLSNIVSEPLDSLLEMIGQRDGLIYTRYSDDVVFSSDSDLTHRKVRTLVHDVARVFAAFGHVLHRKKVTIAPPGARKLVLGLLVDGEQARLSRAYRTRIETHLRGIELFGLAGHAATRHFASVWGMVRHVEGLVAHAFAVDQVYGAQMKQRLSRALAALGWSGTSD